jgi:hypothetical protein
MIAKCKCGILYNDKTVAQCPICHPTFNHQYPVTKEIAVFLKGDEISKHKVSTSNKNSSIATWRQQHLKYRKELYE